MNKRFLTIFFLTLLMVIFSAELFSQCPMCKMAAESNLENGGTAGKGLNKGILYILSLPYLLVATIGLIWYKNRVIETDEQVDS